MSRFRFTDSSCPVCGLSTGKCAQTEDGYGVICWTLREALTRQEINGYTCTKSSADTDSDMGSIWFPTELAHCSDPFERLTLLYEKAVSAGPEPAEAEAPEVAALQVGRNVFVGIEDRDRRHQRMLAELAQEQRFAVSRQHAEAMAERLYRCDVETVRQWMQELGYFSVEHRNQRWVVAEPVPGARACGDKWELRPSKGLYGPMRDCHGHLLGWEVKTDAGSYMVLSAQADTAKSGGADACPLALPESGEQPVNWCLPHGWASAPPKGGYAQIVLTEGKAMKPQITAWRFGVPVFGCGPSHDGSAVSEQLLAACSQLARGGRLILFADAGFLANPGVARGVAKTTAVLDRAGYMPVIACARPWTREKRSPEPGSDAKRPQRRLGQDGETYEGSDPDELPSWDFYRCCSEARPLSDWAQDPRTPEAIREHIHKAIKSVEEVAAQDDHLRRGNAANRRKQHHITPRLLSSCLPVTTFEASEQREATIAALQRARASEAKRFEAFALERMPECRRAERAAVRRYWRTIRTVERWASEAPPQRLLRMVRRSVWAIAQAEAWCELLGCKPAEEELPAWSAHISELEQRLDPSTEVRELMFASAFDRALYQLMGQHPYQPLPVMVFNRSVTGAGKTHAVAEPATSEQLRIAVGGERQGVAIYLNTNYRSPVVQNLQEWTEVPARHGGLIYTEDGRLVRASEGTKEEDLDVPPTCRYAHQFARIATRGHNSSVTSNWCSKQCPYRPQKWEPLPSGVLAGMSPQEINSLLQEGAMRRKGESLCSNKGGDGSCRWVLQEFRPFTKDVVLPDSARSERVQRVRTGTDGLMGLAGYAAGYLSKALVVVDECDQLRSAVMQTISVTHDDLMTMLQELPGLGFSDAASQAQARGLIEALDRLLDPPADLKGVDYGMGVHEVRTDPRVQTALQAVTQAHRCDEDGSVQLSGGWLNGAKAQKHAQRELMGALGLSDEGAQAQAIERVPQTVLADLIAAVMPELVGASGQTLAVGVMNVGGTARRYLQLARRRAEFTEALTAAGAVLVLDATERPEDVLGLLGLADGRAHSEVIKAADGEVELAQRVRLRQVPCLGGMGRRRSEAQTARRDALVDGWRAEAPASEWGLLDHSPFCRSERERPWLTSAARGGNDFAGVERMALVGLPIANLHVLEQEFELRMGSGAADPASKQYRDWQAHQIALELLQAMGRPRLNRRSDGEVVDILLVMDANLAPLFLQARLPVPTPTRVGVFTGEAHRVSAPAQALAVVEQYLRQRQALGLRLPMTQREACRGAGACERGFSRACKGLGLSYLKLKARVQQGRASEEAA